MPSSLAIIAWVVFCAAGELPHNRVIWTRLSAPGFELYTTGDEETARGLIIRLERLRALLQPIVGWRGALRSEPGDERERPVCIIAFGTRDEFQTYAPMGRSIGFFLPGGRRDFVVLDGTRAESHAAAHEYVHFVMAQNGLRLPTWLNEGLAELYSSLREVRDAGRSEIGRYIPGRVLALRRDEWISLEALTAAGSDSAIFTRADLVDSAYAESWLLAHMLVLDPRYEGKFPRLLSALQTSETAGAFQRVYAKSLAEVERDLKAYLEVGQTNVRMLGDSPMPADFRIDVERDTDFDARDALAEMLGNYRGRSGESRQLYRQLERDYPQRVP